MPVREATIADLPALLDLGELVHVDDGHIPFRRPIAEQTLRGLIANPHAAVLMVDGGAIAGIVFRHHFSGEIAGQEVFWWVAPEKRSTNAGSRLATALGAWFRWQGAEIVTYSTLARQNAATLAA